MVKQNVQPIKNVRGFLERLHVPTGPDYFTIFSFWPKGEQQDSVGQFLKTFSPKKGVIIASTNNRHTEPDDAVNPEPITPDHWSSIAWAQWKRACITLNPGITAATTDFSNLKVVIRNNIKNTETMSIIQESVAGKPDGQVIYFYPNDAGDTTSNNPFWPLLGSPNGNGIINMLIYHKAALQSKSITRIGVLIDPEQDYIARMWGELTGDDLGPRDQPLPQA